MEYRNTNQGITLIEMVLTLAIIGILATAAVAIINPGKLLQDGRDKQRLSDLDVLNLNLELARVNNITNFGTASTTYISIPHTSADCGYGSGNPLGLPDLPPNWSYACRPEASYRNIDGTGWVPVDFTNIMGGPPLATIPVDPINDVREGLYYAYVGENSWALAAAPEQEENLQELAANDGGTDPGRVELGSNLSLWQKASGLMAHWKLDEGSGNNTADATGNITTDAVLNGTPVWSMGHLGNALEFNSSGDHVDAGNYGAYNMAGFSHSFALWFKTISQPNVVAQAFNRASGGSGYDLRMSDTTGYLNAIESGNGDNVSIEPAIDYRDNTWHFAVFTVNTDTRTGILYVDGKEVGSDTSSQAFANQSKNLKIGGESGSQRWNGFIDDMRIYHRELSAIEIQKMYTATK